MGRAMTAPMITVPPEWTEQAALWVGWPHLREEWGDALEAARAEIAVFIETASRAVPVKVACGSDEAYASAERALRDCQDRAVLHRVPAGDIWLRDTGPVFAETGTDRSALCFQFNGWGGKFVMPGDTETASAIAAAEQVKATRHDFILEGGAVDFDGAGRLLTTRQCLLNPNRNPGWTEAIAEAALQRAFSVSQVIWLDQGLRGDHTDGHVDNLARFIAPGQVVCQMASGTDDPNKERYDACYDSLLKAGLNVTRIPSPGRIEDAGGQVAAASHMNFVITNGLVILPTYEDVFSLRAVEALDPLFPAHEIVPLPARAILAGGGSFHCMTREVPKFPTRRTA
ncbi:MAG: agmatine deiminase family protein [Pseudomonadota bacterium]